MKRCASFNDVCVGDKVLLKQTKTDNVSTSFSSNPYIVLSKQGSSVVIENDKGRYKRNITHIEKLIVLMMWKCSKVLLSV